MNKKITMIIASFILLFCFLFEFKFAFAETKKDYLISFKDNIDTGVIKDLDGTILEIYNEFNLVKARIDKDFVNELLNNKNIEFVEEDFEVSTYPLDYASYFRGNYPWGVTEINAHKKHEEGIHGTGVKIGILDTGINNVANINLKGGISFVGNNSDDYSDNNGHGTQIASVIGAWTDKYKGVSPGSEIYAIKSLNDNGTGTYSDVISGIEWAIENKLDVLNMSFGGKRHSKALQKAIRQAYNNGILLVAAAGNDSASESKDSIDYPGAYHEVLAVGAIDYNYNRAWFSNTGRKLELVAPGVNIPTFDQNGTMVTTNGTSIAAAHVSGLAALILSENKGFNNKQIRKYLNDNATNLGDRQEYGNGLVNTNQHYEQSAKDVNFGEELTLQEKEYLLGAGWKETAFKDVPIEILKSFIKEGGMQPGYTQVSRTVYDERDNSNENNDVEASLTNGSQITLQVGGYLSTTTSTEKVFKVWGKHNWNKMPINRYTDLVALCWTDSAYWKSINNYQHTWYGAIPITEYVSPYKYQLKAGVAYKVDLRAGSSDDTGYVQNTLYLPKSSSGYMQVMFEYSHSWTGVLPSVGYGSGGFSFGISPVWGTDYVDNPPVKGFYY